MVSLNIIKGKIRRLFITNPNIHINVSLVSPKINLKNEPAVIKGVYPHIFQIEECSSGSPKVHTVQYAEVLLNHFEIVELREN